MSESIFFPSTCLASSCLLQEPLTKMNSSLTLGSQGPLHGFKKKSKNNSSLKDSVLEGKTKAKADLPRTSQGPPRQEP